MSSSRTLPHRFRLAGALGAVALAAGCATPAPPPAPVTPPVPAPSAAVPANLAADVDDVVIMPPATGTRQKANSRIDTTNSAQAAPPVQPAEGNVALLAYADRVRTMPPAELSQEIARLGDTSGDAQRTPFQDLQLAVALAQTRNTQDTMRAQTLLQRLLNNQSEAARRLHPLARLLTSRYGDQRRLEDMVERQSQQLRDNQRRIDQLSERLEAVRAIERSLTRSGANGAAAATPSAAPAAPAAKPNP